MELNLKLNNMRNWTEFHTANKESVAQWMFDCGYEDLKEPGKMKVDDLIACDWLTLRGYMPYEEHPYKMTGQQL